MRRPVSRTLLLAAAAAALARAGVCADIDLRGQLSLWLGVHDKPVREAALGVRYIPTLSLKLDLGGGAGFDAEASVNAFAAAQGPSIGALATSGEAKPYRLWVRFTTARLEARAGLQKINFGSAMLLRPLMWFDRLDYNDPLQLTDGVYGLLLKYTLPDNASVWVWGLLGNDRTKGWETAPSIRTSPEFGGRVQIPAFAGELAATYHHRRLDAAGSLVPLPPGERTSVAEDRIALDGKWDVGPGVWIEGVLARQDYALYPLRFQKMLAVGLDYTFGLGNGLHLLAEHLALDASSGAWRTGESRSLSALTLDYPLGLLDRLRGVAFHDWKTGDWYRLLTWQRTYDRWSLFLIAFWNPDRYQIYAGAGSGNLFAGKGVQFTVVFNH
jgi:hypothetical protein